MQRRTLELFLGMGGLLLGAGVACYLALIGAPAPPLASDPQAAKKVVSEVAPVAALAGLSVDALPSSGVGTTPGANQLLISQMAGSNPEALHRLVEHGWIRVSQAMGGLTSLGGQKATELGLAVGQAGLYWQGRGLDESPGHYWERTIPFGWSALRRWRFLDEWPTEDRTGQDLLPMLMATLLGPDQATPERFYRRLAHLLGKFQPLGLPIAMSCALAAQTWQNLLLIICTPAASESPRQRLARAASLVEAGLSWSIVRATIGLSPHAFPREWASLAWRAGDWLAALSVLPDPFDSPWRQDFADLLLAMPPEAFRQSAIPPKMAIALRNWAASQVADLLKEASGHLGGTSELAASRQVQVLLTLGPSCIIPVCPVMIRFHDDAEVPGIPAWVIATLSWAVPNPLTEVAAAPPEGAHRQGSEENP